MKYDRATCCPRAKHGVACDCAKFLAETDPLLHQVALDEWFAMLWDTRSVKQILNAYEEVTGKPMMATVRLPDWAPKGQGQ